MPALPELAPDFRDRFVGELKRVKAAFFGMVVAQAQTVECDGRRLIFTFGPEHEHLRNQIESRRGELEKVAEQLAGQPRADCHDSRCGAIAERAGAAASLRPRCRRSPRTPTCAPARWRTPTCRRCSRSSLRRSGTWRRCERADDIARCTDCRRVGDGAARQRQHGRSNRSKAREWSWNVSSGG